MLFINFNQGQFGTKCITKASWTWWEKCNISNYLQFFTVIGTYTYLEKDTAHWLSSHAIFRLRKFRTCILSSTIRLRKMFERKYENHAKLNHKILISAFAKYLTVFAKVLYLKGRQITRLCLDPILRFSFYFLFPEILNLKLFGNSLAKSYIKFTFDELKLY